MKQSSRSTSQRVLSAIRAYFADHEIPPSHQDIAERAGIASKRVQGYVEKLAAGGYLTYTRRVGRSIQLTDRLANYSTDDVRRACAARGLSIVSLDPAPIVEGVADWGLPLLDKLDDIP
ncbi:LexA family protein [Sphingomonas solaris]|uniref:LexA repressor DNA-binding domain-containing protein n=1 Tax=Alterirhizorhabdus solaris TaxID=2529389 RepID=A0A558R839_9SPHN|nr:hypothetical protein [Sphingomonas solaris]TVV75559.1 hypothetical protein FOY91_06780 [Sphingomonas solaris]